MGRTAVALLGLLLAAGRSAAETDGDVLVLTASNFDALVKPEPLIAVEFYAPWCGHCKSLAPHWSAAATELKASGLKLAKVDATVEESLAKKYGVSGYPTIKLFRNGKESEYKGPRETEGIVSYMLDQASSGAAKVGAAELDVALLRLRDDAPEPLVVYFAAKASDYEGTAGLLGKKPAALAAAFAAAADELRESFSFAWTADPAALAAHGAAPNSVAVLQPPLLGKSETGAVYGGAAEADALAAWVWGASLPLVGELTPRTEPRYAKAGLPLARVALATDWRNDPKGANYHLNRLRKLAAAYAGRLRVAAVKPASPLAALAEFGVDDAAAAAGPAVTVTDAKGKRYAAPAPWSAKDPAATAAFLDSFLGGAVAAHVKSEAVPAGPDNGVTVVVGRTFDDLVTGAVDKDVLVEFYAPWCGHCKSLAPKYEALAQGLAGVSTLVIAKLDATANDWTPKDVYEVKGFPTIYFKPAGKPPVAYEGEREAPAMAAWLAAHATHTFDVPAALGAAPPAAAKKAKKAKKAAAEAPPAEAQPEAKPAAAEGEAKPEAAAVNDEL